MAWSFAFLPEDTRVIKHESFEPLYPTKNQLSGEPSIIYGTIQSLTLPETLSILASTRIESGPSISTELDQHPKKRIREFSSELQATKKPYVRDPNHQRSDEEVLESDDIDSLF